jgi:predicted transcriptional regulator
VKYRSRLDIVAHILEIANEGARKTEILYKAFLSYPQLRDYLDALTGSGMLMYREEKATIFYTTEKGKRLLDMYKEIDGMIPKENMLTKVMK